MFAVALGAGVTVISHSSSKKSDADKMSAKHFAETGKSGWADPLSRSLNLIICTSFAKDMPIEQCISLLDIGGTMGMLEAALPPPHPTLMIGIMLR